MNENNVLFIYPFCKIIKGYARSAIYDLELNKLHSISNGVYAFIEASQGRSEKEIYALFYESDREAIGALISSLIEKRIVRFVDKEDYFRFLPMQNHPQRDSLLDNFVIDIDSDSDYDITQVLEKIHSFCLQAIQIRFLYPIHYKLFTAIVNIVYKTCIDSIEIVVPYTTIKDCEDLYKLFDDYQNITNMYIWDAESNNVEDYKQCRIIYMRNKINSSDSCGKISSDSFLCSKKFFLEAQDYNTCLARKCAIDKME